MSTIKANTILDSAGGNTATINGITPALASQAEAQAGTDNTKLMTPLRVDQAILALTDAAVVGAATAGLATGAIGDYVLALRNGTTTGYDYGSTIAGSRLNPATSGAATSATTLSGTWKLLGFIQAGGNTVGAVSVFKRIS